ncbi:Uncharacterised protein [Mycobacteroides abscessus subsp. abscessus]|nr:Uncharacterised protein [Mycobacteroides abscessus subsp. abscessus]
MTESSSVPASAGRRPRTVSSGSPASSLSMPSRTANSTATGSLPRRRVTKARVCRETRSSHCASSITHSTG